MAIPVELESSTNWQAVADTIRARRSNLAVDLERPVPGALIDELIDLATRAPNHHRTNPWRVVVLTGTARARLGEVVAGALAAARPDEKPAAIERQRVQFLRSPVVLVVASAGDPDPVRHLENCYAVAAGIENILIGATAAGLASAWKSGPAMVDPLVTVETKEALGLDPADEIIGFVYLGYPIGDPNEKPDKEPWVRHLDS